VVGAALPLLFIAALPRFLKAEADLRQCAAYSEVLPWLLTEAMQIRVSLEEPHILDEPSPRLFMQDRAEALNAEVLSVSVCWLVRHSRL
jgi:hypothetical protein